MKVSAKAEYGCLAMLDLAARFTKGQPVSIKAISDAHGLSGGFLVQILLQLKGAGLVASSRGATGGYQLAKPPEAISLADIIDIIDGPPGATSALAGLPESPLIGVLLASWQRVHISERAILEKLTLAELLEQAKAGESITYQI